MEDNEKGKTESILAEEIKKVKVPNYSKIYGLSYGMVQHILESYDKKAE